MVVMVAVAVVVVVGVVVLVVVGVVVIVVMVGYWWGRRGVSGAGDRLGKGCRSNSWINTTVLVVVLVVVV